MSTTGHYLKFSKHWEYEPPDSSVGILSDGMTHVLCLSRENSGTADLAGGGPAGVRLSGGYERFFEHWTCRDCGTTHTFILDGYTGWDQLPEGA